MRYYVGCHEMPKTGLFFPEKPIKQDAFNYEMKRISSERGEWNNFSEEFDDLESAEKWASEQAYFSVKDTGSDYYIISACFVDISEDDYDDDGDIIDSKIILQL